MTKCIVSRPWISTFFLAVILASSGMEASAQETAYKQIELPYGISIKTPSHWKILSIDTRNNLKAASEAVMESSELHDGVASKKESLLAINSTPAPTGAMIRVSVTLPSDYSQSDLSAATTEDLNLIHNEFLMIFKKLEGNGGPKVRQVYQPRIDKINGKYALVISYTREDINIKNESWLVTQYKIPNNNHLIEFTLSHRQSDSVLWKPILEKVKHSLRF